MELPGDELDGRTMRNTGGSDGRRSNRGMRPKVDVVLGIGSVVPCYRSENQEGDPFHAGSL